MFEVGFYVGKAITNAINLLLAVNSVSVRMNYRDPTVDLQVALRDLCQSLMLVRSSFVIAE